MSARGRLEANGSTASLLRGGAPQGGPYNRTQSECALNQGTLHSTSRRNSPVELQTAVRSPREHVCGAELSAHWGMSDTDGSMSTFVLASQVLQRLSSKGVNGLNRSALLSQLAAQLEQFHHVQLSWDEQWHAARDATTNAHDELRHRDAEIDKIQADTQKIVEEHQSRLGSVCQEMCAEVDAQKLLEHENDNKMGRSQQRLAEQKALNRVLADESKALVKSLDVTHMKFNEVSRSFHTARDAACLASSASSNPIQQSSWREAPSQGNDVLPSASPYLVGPGTMIGAATELRGATARAESLAIETEDDRFELLDLKNHLSRLKADLANESTHGARLEDFVRRIAEGPSASVRCGGGFALDSTAKREAKGLLNLGSMMSSQAQMLAGVHPVAEDYQQQLRF